MLGLVRQIKEDQVKESDATLEALKQSRSNVVERFRYLHRPEALSLRTVVLSDGSTRADVFTQDRYIADVEPFFAANDFYEIDIAHRVERFGQVAHAWSLYEARSAPDSPVVLKRGANSIQLCFEQDRWWVVSTIWDNEREGVRFDLW